MKYKKTPVSNFTALNQAKKQRANVLLRHRNLPFWILKSETK